MSWSSRRQISDGNVLIAKSEKVDDEKVLVTILSRQSLIEDETIHAVCGRVYCALLLPGAS